MINECRTAGEMKIGRGHQHNQRKSAQIPHDLTRDLTQATVVRSWKLTTQTMAWPTCYTQMLTL
jgi:hypothetical protein